MRLPRLRGCSEDEMGGRQIRKAHLKVSVDKPPDVRTIEQPQRAERQPYWQKPTPYDARDISDASILFGKV